MADEDPRRLKSSGEASPELQRALRALRDRSDDAARLSRVAGKLGAMLDAPLPPTAAPESNGVLKLGGTKTGVIAVAGVTLVLAAISFVLYSLRSGGPAADPAPREDEVASAPVVPAPSVPPSAAPPESQPLGIAPETDKPRRVAASSGQSGGSQKSRAARSSTPAQSSTPVNGAEPRVNSPSQPAVAPALEPSPAEEPAAKKDPIRPEEPAEPQRTEVQLLYEARKSMSGQPLAALKLLNEHAARFPRGMLAPEREVLVIEALRSVGRTSEATERLQQFRARYPKSLHLRRLETGTGGATKN